MKQILRNILTWLRFLPILPGVDWSDERLRRDVARWSEILHLQGRRSGLLAELLFGWPEFRNLFLYRNSRRLLYRAWARLFYKPMDTLYLQAEEIGGGLFIQHGFATMLAAKSVGEDCWINQQVTVGFRDQGEPPVIGNRVMITCGAKVLGNITVGDGTVIGANAVVVKDVDPGATMVGIPAQRIK